MQYQNKFIISEPYYVEPSEIKYDIEFSQFNPVKSEDDYKKLLLQIKEQGQLDPGYMKKNRLGDGTHRARACLELGIKMMVVDIDPEISNEDYIIICNTNTFSSRNDSPTQLAIKGFKLVEEFGFSNAKATRMLGLKDKSAIGYVGYIKASKLNFKYNILEKLLSGEPVNINGKITKSLDVAKRTVARLEEAEAKNDSLIEPTAPKIDYNALIESEAGRDEFWSEQENILGVNAKLKAIKWINAAYPGKR